MRIVIAPDKFKGTMTAREVSEAMAEGVRECGVTGDIQIFPMADGGDGTAEVLRNLLPDCNVVEAHQYIGPERFSAPPMMRSSYALGAAVMNAATKDAPVYVGIGGTGCCDGGAGMLQAMGLKAYRRDGSEILEPLCPANLTEIDHVDKAQLTFDVKLIVLSDVEATLLPDNDGGLSALDFAMQKGFSPVETGKLYQCLSHWKRIISPDISSAIDGAGGGTGFALGAVMGAEIRQGASFIADSYNLLVGNEGLIITGEGCIDRQTQGGKVVEELYRRAREKGIPFIAVGGKVLDCQSFMTISVDDPSESLPKDTAEAKKRLKCAILRKLPMCMCALGLPDSLGQIQ